MRRQTIPARSAAGRRRYWRYGRSALLAVLALAALAPPARAEGTDVPLYLDVGLSDGLSLALGAAVTPSLRAEAELGYTGFSYITAMAAGYLDLPLIRFALGQVTALPYVGAGATVAREEFCGLTDVGVTLRAGTGAIGVRIGMRNRIRPGLSGFGPPAANVTFRLPLTF